VSYRAKAAASQIGQSPGFTRRHWAKPLTAGDLMPKPACPWLWRAAWPALAAETAAAVPEPGVGNNPAAMWRACPRMLLRTVIGRGVAVWQFQRIPAEYLRDVC
jgi:hypothetical protein